MNKWMPWNWFRKKKRNPGKLIAAIPKKSEIKNLEPWKYATREFRSAEFLDGPQQLEFCPTAKRDDRVPVAIVRVSGLDTSFKFDGSDSFNPLGGNTLYRWYFNDVLITTVPTFEYDMDANTDYVIRFEIISDANYDTYGFRTAGGVMFEIPLAAALATDSPLDYLSELNQES